MPADHSEDLTYIYPDQVYANAVSILCSRVQRVLGPKTKLKVRKVTQDTNSYTKLDVGLVFSVVFFCACTHTYTHTKPLSHTQKHTLRTTASTFTFILHHHQRNLQNFCVKKRVLFILHLLLLFIRCSILFSL